MNSRNITQLLILTVFTAKDREFCIREDIVVVDVGGIYYICYFNSVIENRASASSYTFVFDRLIKNLLLNVVLLGQ